MKPSRGSFRKRAEQCSAQVKSSSFFHQDKFGQKFGASKGRTKFSRGMKFGISRENRRNLQVLQLGVQRIAPWVATDCSEFFSDAFRALPPKKGWIRMTRVSFNQDYGGSLSALQMARAGMPYIQYAKWLLLKFKSRSKGQKHVIFLHFFQDTVTGTAKNKEKRKARGNSTVMFKDCTRTIQLQFNAEEISLKATN
ncbi:hypothetical protein COCNU_02G005090 [Cocos nucifera]|uniref:Uncharacterized protein n=1 Tax=Cocos nucifera TaxID=13894 RepID=A0A8K0HYB7_COCNU|nr:hypothetical protein COCNU_02G005090 [Cocos nucifera]